MSKARGSKENVSLLAALQDLHARLDQATGRIYVLEKALTNQGNASPIKCYSPVAEVDGAFEVDVRDVSCAAVIDACGDLEIIEDAE